MTFCNANMKFFFKFLPFFSVKKMLFEAKVDLGEFLNASSFKFNEVIFRLRGPVSVLQIREGPL